MLVGKGPGRSWDTLQDTPENLWNFSQVPLVQGSQSIVVRPKEGLCFLGKPQLRSGDLIMRGDSVQKSEVGRENATQAGNGNWPVLPSQQSGLPLRTCQQKSQLQQMDEDRANVCLGQGTERYDKHV